MPVKNTVGEPRATIEAGSGFGLAYKLAENAEPDSFVVQSTSKSGASTPVALFLKLTVPCARAGAGTQASTASSAGSRHAGMVRSGFTFSISFFVGVTPSASGTTGRCPAVGQYIMARAPRDKIEAAVSRCGHR